MRRLLEIFGDVLGALALFVLLIIATWATAPAPF